MPPSGAHRGGGTTAAPQDRSAPRFIDIDFCGDVGARNPLQTKPPPSRNAWIGATDLRISLRIEIGDWSLHLHKFPLISKSEKLNRLVFESRDTELARVNLSDIPGGAGAVELVARYLYGGEIEVSAENVAALRCAAEYLEISDGLVAKTENYLNSVVAGSWRDSITVLRTCSALAPWAEELQVVRRCSESVAWKCFDPHSARWSFSTGKDALSRDWWFHDVCSLPVDTFALVVHALTAKGVSLSLVAAAVECYAEKWLPKALEPDATATQCRSIRAVVHRVVSLLAPGPESAPLALLLKLLRFACAADASPSCKTDLARRVGVHFEKLALDDLLIPAAGKPTYDVDVVQQIVEFFLQHQNYAASSPPNSPRRSSISGSSFLATTSTSRCSSWSCSQRLSSASSTDLSSIGASDSGTIGRSLGPSASCSVSFASEATARGSHASSETSSSSPGDAADVKLAVLVETSLSKKSDAEHPSRPRSHLPFTTRNVKLGQLLETYLDEVARDASISLAKFVSLADLITEFPRDSDDGVYRAIDTFLKAHPTLKEMERKKLCRVIDTGALSLAACVHAASNERLPLRVIVQVLFSEQIKLRNAITGNEVMIDKEVHSSRLQLPNFSCPTSISESVGDPTCSSNASVGASCSCSSGASKSQLSSGGGAGGRASSSQTAVRETLRCVTAEVESLKRAVHDLEAFKARLSDAESLQLEIRSLASRFQDMTHDYTGMIVQVEELTRVSKQKSGWSSGWKKVAKSFHSKDHHDSATSKSEHHHATDTAPAPAPRRMARASERATGSKKPAAALQPPRTPTPQPPRIPMSQPLRLTSASASQPPRPPEHSGSTTTQPPQQEHEAVALIMAVEDEAASQLEAAKEDEGASELEAATEGETPTPSTSGRREPEPEPKPEAEPEPEPEPEVGSRGSQDRLGPRDESGSRDPSIPARRKPGRSSTSPERAHRRGRHRYGTDSDDSVSVTSASSCTSTSTSASVSGVSSRGARQRRRDRSEGRRSVDARVHRSRNRPSSVHKSEHSGGGNAHRHRRHERHRHRRRSSSQRRRQEESEKRSGHRSRGSHHDHSNQSVDSHARHANGRDRHRGSILSLHSSHPPKDRRVDAPGKRSSHRRRHQRHGHHKDIFSDSDGSSDSGSRRRHR